MENKRTPRRALIKPTENKEKKKRLERICLRCKKTYTIGYQNDYQWLGFCCEDCSKGITSSFGEKVKKQVKSISNKPRQEIKDKSMSLSKTKREMTAAEKKLWDELKQRKLKDTKFKVLFIGESINFWAPKIKLLIEMKDDQVSFEKDVTVLQFKDKDIIDNLNQVVIKISKTIDLICKKMYRIR